MSLLGDIEVLGGINAFFAERCDFLLKDVGLDENTVADNIQFLLMKDARRNDMENMFDAVKF